MALKLGAGQSGTAALDATPAVAVEDGTTHGGPAAGIEVGVVKAHAVLYRFLSHISDHQVGIFDLFNQLSDLHLSFFG